jgi:outer membrane immunogenic protein
MKTQKLIILLMFLGYFSFGQGTLGKEKTQLNIGIGLSGWGLPVYFGFDYGINDDFTIGGEASFRSFREKYAGLFYNHSIIGLSGNANYHFNRIIDLPQEWDFYAGLNLGFYFWSSPRNYLGSGSSGLGLGAQVGGRYFLNDKFGFNLEFGGGNAFYGGKFGVTIKM